MVVIELDCINIELNCYINIEVLKKIMISIRF